jgi:hypothetical protein
VRQQRQTRIKYQRHALLQHGQLWQIAEIGNDGIAKWYAEEGGKSYLPIPGTRAVTDYDGNAMQHDAHESARRNFSKSRSIDERARNDAESTCNQHATSLARRGQATSPLFTHVSILDISRGRDKSNERIAAASLSLSLRRRRHSSSRQSHVTTHRKHSLSSRFTTRWHQQQRRLRTTNTHATASSVIVTPKPSTNLCETVPSLVYETLLLNV